MRKRVDLITKTGTQMRKKIDLTKKIETKTKTIIRRTTTHFYQNPIFAEETTTEEENNELEDESEETPENEEDNNESSNNDNDSNVSSNETLDNQNYNTQNINQTSNNNRFINGLKDGITNFRENAKKKAVKNAATESAKAKTAAAFFKNPVVIKILLIILIASLCFIGLLLIIVLIASAFESNSLSFGGYYESRCDEMTVIFVDKNNGYEVTGSETYSMDDYVAGVVYAEVGGFKNKEVYKVFSIAARTFALKHASEDCSIEGSARRQAFKDITDKQDETTNLIYEAVQETSGEVLLSNGELYSVTYDAFCYVDKDSSYYTLSQQNQQIPTDWVETNVRNNNYKNCPCNLKDESMTECWNNSTWKDGGHGSGMSQYGALYLATEEGYTYDKILSYYYGEDEISISSNAFIASIAGLEIKDTRKASPLKEPITTFLSSKGSSLDNLNNFVHESVSENGAGTREGVVTAAVSLINYLYDNFNVKLPYYWGGKIYSSTSIPQSFGTYSPSAVSRGGGVNYYKSFDCSGFASWAIRTGGYNFSNQSTVGFDSNYSKNSCDMTETTCIGQPGDLINSRSGHVELIIAVDEASGKYFVAHSGGSDGVVMMQRDMHKGHNSKTTKIIFMEEFYSNPSNVNTAY